MSLKNTLANWMLPKKLGNEIRPVRFHNFDTARTIGVLWSFEEKSAFQKITNFAKGKPFRVKSLHFNIAQDAELFEGNSFNNKHLDWLGFPKKGFVNEFVLEKFDILIDLSVKKKQPMQLIMALSKSSFKVGYSDQAIHYYDLNIDVNQHPEPDYLAEQILKYLTQINTK